MRKYILDTPIDWVSTETVIRQLKQFTLTHKPHQITTVNPEFIVLAQDNPDFRAVLQKSDLSLPDGTGIVLAQTLNDSVKANNWLTRFLTYIALGTRFIMAPQSFEYKRVTGVELTDLILQLSARQQWRVFLLGAAAGVAKQAAAAWQGQYPGLIIAGASAANPDDKQVLDEVKAAQPHVLLVAYGAPKQDLFIAHHARELRIPIMVGVGGTFDYAVKNLHRAPSFMRAIGLEWLVRLIQQPKRLKRIWRSTVIFSLMIISRVAS